MRSRIRPMRAGEPPRQQHDAHNARMLRGRFATIRLILCGALAFSMGVAARLHARAALPPVDANKLVRAMIARYQSAHSYTERSEARVTKDHGLEIIQTGSLVYKHPNLLLVVSTDPDLGTIQSYSNGSVVTFYSGKSNQYTRRTAPATLPLAVVEVSRAAERLTGSPQALILSPLGFLGAKGMPREASNFRYVTTKNVLGHQTVQVEANADRTWLKTQFPPSLKVDFDRRKITLWIDSQSQMLVRAECDFAWHIQKDNPGGPVTRGSIYFIETHRDIMLNQAIRDEQFNFMPPKNAIEVFQEGH